MLSVCRSWNDQIPLSEMDQNFPCGGTTGSGHSYLDFLFCYSKVLRPHARLYDAVEAIWSHTGQHQVTVTWLDADQTDVCMVT